MTNQPEEHLLNRTSSWTVLYIQIFASTSQNIARNSSSMCLNHPKLYHMDEGQPPSSWAISLAALKFRIVWRDQMRDCCMVLV